MSESVLPMFFSRSFIISGLIFRSGCESWTVKKAERQRTDALNCGVGEDLRVLGLKGDPTSPF